MSGTTESVSIRQLDTERSDLYHFEVTGHMRADDVQRIYALLMDAYDKHGKIDLLVDMNGYDGFDWSAAFTDTTYAAKSRSMKHIRRYAIVGGPGWIHAMVGIFDPLFHVEMRAFDENGVDTALAWLNEE